MSDPMSSQTTPKRQKRAVADMDQSVPFLQVADLGYRAGPPAPKQILSGVKFQAGKGEMVGIVGANGAGKSTLLRLIGGLLKPTAGSVKVDGSEVSRIPAREYARICSYLPQSTNLTFDFTVREIVSMGRHPYRRGLASLTREDLRITDESIAEAGCEEFTERLITSLSGGERQRVMFARLLAQDTPLVLLDEPTASLDIRYAVELLHVARELAQHGKLVLAVLHDLRAAARVCDRLLLMHEGQLVAAGDPEDVLHEGHISYAYGIRARTFRNPLDQWDFAVDD